MKALILAGGEGTRLRPLTFTAAKQLIPVANKPTVFYGIEDIVEAGIDEIGVIVGDTREDIMETVGDGSRWDVEIEYIHQEEPLGLAHAVKIAEDYLADDPFVMYLGDNILRDGINEFVRTFQEQDPDALILLTPVENPSLYGVAELEEDGTVRSLEEKPDDPSSNLALVGVYLFDPVVFEAVDQLEPSWRGELEITHAIQWLLDEGYEVLSYTVQGWWKDTGNAGDMLEANQLVLQTIESDLQGTVDEATEIVGSVRIGENSEVRNSVIRGPAVIGEDTKVEDAYIGPFTSIGNQVTIVSAEVEHSILMNGCRLEGLTNRVDQSILGMDVSLVSTPGRPRTHQLILGDQSEIELSQ